MKKLKEKYKEKVIPKMKEKEGYKNSMAIPKIKKVIVNAGFGGKVQDETSNKKKEIIDEIIKDLGLITGQSPVINRAKKSVAAFEVRKGDPVGAMVTLRGERMYSFLERLIHIALPRSKDFKGIDLKSFDENGNLNIAIEEHVAFPEINPDKSKVDFSFQVTIVTTAKEKKEGIKFLRLLDFPLKEENN